MVNSLPALARGRDSRIPNMRERDIINKHFNFADGKGVILGIGDDAAIVRNPNKQLAISTDTMAEGTHFRKTDNPYYLARKAAAVSLSDMAAMGAKPLWMTISLTTTKQPQQWFAAIARGFASSAKEHNYKIIGGDLTTGKQTQLTTTAIGELNGKPITRKGAKPGDDIWLSGTTGDAALALQTTTTSSSIKQRLHNPTPRIKLGMSLTSIASAAIDLSDGLASATSDIAQSSRARLTLESAMLPMSAAMRKVNNTRRLKLMLEGGDDYELLFCASPRHRKTIGGNFGAAPVTRIGAVSKGSGAYISLNGKTESLSGRGYEHNFGK